MMERKTANSSSNTIESEFREPEIIPSNKEPITTNPLLTKNKNNKMLAKSRKRLENNISTSWGK